MQWQASASSSMPAAVCACRLVSPGSSSTAVVWCSCAIFSAHCPVLVVTVLRSLPRRLTLHVAAIASFLRGEASSLGGWAPATSVLAVVLAPPLSAPGSGVGSSCSRASPPTAFALPEERCALTVRTQLSLSSCLARAGRHTTHFSPATANAARATGTKHSVSVTNVASLRSPET